MPYCHPIPINNHGIDIEIFCRILYRKNLDVKHFNKQKHWWWIFSSKQLLITLIVCPSLLLTHAHAQLLLDGKNTDHFSLFYYFPVSESGRCVTIFECQSILADRHRCLFLLRFFLLQSMQNKYCALRRREIRHRLSCCPAASFDICNVFLLFSFVFIVLLFLIFSFLFYIYTNI